MNAEILMLKVDEMGIAEWKLILESKLDPLQQAIVRLEESNLQIVNLLTSQARLEETVRNIQKDHDTVFHRIREIEGTQNDRSWDIIKMALTALLGGVVSAWIFKKS